MHGVITVIAQNLIVLPVVYYVYLCFIKRKELLSVLLFSVIYAVIAFGLVVLAGRVHSDPRPFISDGMVPYFTSATNNGFPSDHTAVSAVLALLVFRYHKAAGLVLLAVAAIIGAARVLGNVHHTQDIIGAICIAILGYVFAQLLFTLGARVRTNGT